MLLGYARVSKSDASQNYLINIVHDIQSRGIGFKVLTGQGADIDTNTANGRLIFSIFASLAEYERELISERTKAGLASARARGRKGGRKFKMIPICRLPKWLWKSQKLRSQIFTRN
ncbi:MAG: recombinase family protein [Alphaproteobacteria bacterium]|nr:recombinase family protein [Alphaproteobacteria bacterium]